MLINIYERRKIQMKKLTIAALALLMLAGCGSSATYTKTGLGVVSSYNTESGQVNTTFVALGLDADGKIAYIDLDVAQSTPGSAEQTQTKEELKEGYGMKSVSASFGNIADGGEWYEQAKAFEEWCIGKTPEEVAAVETVEVNGHMVAQNEADLYAGCTIQITDFQAAVTKAADNAVEVEAEEIVLGRTMSNDASAGQVSTDLVLLAKDADGKVVYAKWDVAQISASTTETKSERGSDYGMVGASGIGKEWNEQAAAFEEWCVGKTVDEILAMETMDYHGGKAPNTGTDLAAGVTITVDGLLTAVQKAK